MVPVLRFFIPFLRQAALAGLVFTAAAVLGLAVMVTLFKAGVLGGITILFYRGLVLAGIAALVTGIAVAVIGQRFGGATLRDAFAAGVLVLGLDTSFLVVAPVTVDRSITVFMAGYLAAADQRPLSAVDLERAFIDRYIGAMHQIERRIDEQVRSGNVVARGEGYVLTPQGQGFVRTSRLVAWLFDTDRRLVNQQPPAADQVTDRGSTPRPAAGKAAMRSSLQN